MILELRVGHTLNTTVCGLEIKKKRMTIYSKLYNTEIKVNFHNNGTKFESPEKNFKFLDS